MHFSRTLTEVSLVSIFTVNILMVAHGKAYPKGDTDK